MSKTWGFLVGTLLSAGLALALLVPAAARAELQTIDFEGSGVEVPFAGEGKVLFPQDPGYRPFLRDAGARAHSGSVVGDLNNCVDDNGISCGESFQAETHAVLSATAGSVTVFAGSFSTSGEEAFLVAYDAAGNEVGSDSVAIDDQGFDARLSVEAPDIASFRIFARTEGGAGAGGDLGIDDLQVDFAAGGSPDFTVSVSAEVVRLVQGEEVAVPVRLTRLNGSNGPVELTVSGLPEGVTASFEPDPVDGGGLDATLTLEVAPGAAPTGFEPVDVTITATPLDPTTVGPGPRTATLSVRVIQGFGLAFGEAPGLVVRGPTVSFDAPDCAPVDIPIRVTRDIATAQDVVLSLTGLFGTAFPKGVSAEFLPSPVVHPGGGLVAERTLRVRALPEADLEKRGGGFDVLATAASGVQKLSVGFQRLAPTATVRDVRQGSRIGLTPRFGSAGTTMRVDGSGFCAGTEVTIGQSERVAATLVDDRTLEFTLPRTATTGPVTVIPPAPLPRYASGERVLVDSLRNTDGLGFRNYPLHGVSLDELIQGYGADDLFFTVNPCWPFGECRVVTGILNPIAAIDWGLINLQYSHPNSGHCFGMDMLIQQLVSGKQKYRRFLAKPGEFGRFTAHEIDPPPQVGGHNGELDGLLDSLQIRTDAQELVDAFFHRNKSLRGVLDELEREFRHHREVNMALFNGGVSAHTVLAYDLTQDADSAEIHVWDSDQPYEAKEEADTLLHQHLLEAEVIHIDKRRKTWSFEFNDHKPWGGGNDGSLWAIPAAATPDDPSLPGLGVLKDALAYLIFGSAGVDVVEVFTPQQNYLPMLFGRVPGGGPAGGGTVVGPEGKPLSATFVGQGPGRYSQAYAGAGFVASVAGVRTRRGVRDRLSGKGETLRFESGAARPLRFKLGRQAGAELTESATLTTRASAGGADSAGFTAPGALLYAHSGAPTTVEFTLTQVRRDGGPATFVSRPLRVGRGERFSALPLGRSLGRVRVRIADRSGRVRTLILRNRAHASRHLRLGAARIEGHRVSVRMRASGVVGRAFGGATVRFLRGGRVVGESSRALRVADRARTISWRLPRRLGPGRYRLVTDLRVISAAGRGAVVGSNVRTRRSTQITIRGKAHHAG